MSFIVRKEGFSLSSPIIRIPVLRAIEPDEESLPYSFQTDVLAQLQQVVGANTEHDKLSIESRYKQNQHPIKAISGLKEKVDVFVGNQEPMEKADTWFDVIEIDEEAVVGTN